MLNPNKGNIYFLWKQRKVPPRRYFWQFLYSHSLWFFFLHLLLCWGFNRRIMVDTNLLKSKFHKSAFYLMKVILIGLFSINFNIRKRWKWQPKEETGHPVTKTILNEYMTNNQSINIMEFTYCEFFYYSRVLLFTIY